MGVLRDGGKRMIDEVKARVPTAATHWHWRDIFPTRTCWVPVAEFKIMGLHGRQIWIGVDKPISTNYRLS